MVLARSHTFGAESIFDRSLRKGEMWTFEEWNPSCGTDWLKRFVPTSRETMVASKAWCEVLAEQQKEAKLIRALDSRKEQVRKDAGTGCWEERFMTLLAKAQRTIPAMSYAEAFTAARAALKDEQKQRQREKDRAAAVNHKRYLSLMAAAKAHDVGQERIRRRAEKKKLAKEYKARQEEETLKANKATLAKKRAKKARKKANRREREAQQTLDDPMEIDFL